MKWDQDSEVRACFHSWLGGPDDKTCKSNWPPRKCKSVTLRSTSIIMSQYIPRWPHLTIFHIYVYISNCSHVVISHCMTLHYSARSTWRCVWIAKHTCRNCISVKLWEIFEASFKLTTNMYNSATLLRLCNPHTELSDSITLQLRNFAAAMKKSICRVVGLWDYRIAHL